jgi:cell division protein FtsQ
VLRRKKTRKNFRKGTKAKRHFKLWGCFLFCINLIAGVTVVAAMTGVFILLHDVLTQSDYFKAKSLKVEGVQRLTKDAVAKEAGIYSGVNILAVNLSQVRKRLLANPWIAEAEVIREIPSGLIIRIKEQVPIAVIDIGQKFLINHRGEIFKEWDPSDPSNLPMVSGLDVSDLRVYAPSSPTDRRIEPKPTAPFNAVMRVLQLGEEKESVLPNQIIKHIRVDRQIGLTLYTVDRMKAINLGYNDYAGKYQMLESLFSYLKRQQSISDFDRIDLNNLNRIVLNPITIEAPRKGS